MTRLRAAVIGIVLLAGATTAQAQTEIIEYYALDQLGSVRVVFDANGTIIGRMDYGPFGQSLAGATNMPDRMYAGLFRDGEVELDAAGARSYQVRTGRFTTVDPVYAGLFAPQRWNRYAYALNNPVSIRDADGLLATSSFCTWTERQVEGGLSSTLTCPSPELQNFASSGAAWSPASGWAPGTIPPPRNDSGPLELGIGWLTGTAPRVQTFVSGDPLTEAVQQSAHVQELRDQVATSCQSVTHARFDNRLSGWRGLPKYLRDYSTVLTGGQTGNLAATYLGSYTLDYSVVAGGNGQAALSVTIKNASTLGSAVRPPLVGYSPWWQENVAARLTSAAEGGPMQTTSQVITWSETVPCSGKQ